MSYLPFLLSLHTSCLSLSLPVSFRLRLCPSEKPPSRVCGKDVELQSLDPRLNPPPSPLVGIEVKWISGASGDSECSSPPFFSFLPFQSSCSSFSRHTSFSFSVDSLVSFSPRRTTSSSFHPAGWCVRTVQSTPEVHVTLQMNLLLFSLPFLPSLRSFVIDPLLQDLHFVSITAKGFLSPSPLPELYKTRLFAGEASPCFPIHLHGTGFKSASLSYPLQISLPGYPDEDRDEEFVFSSFRLGL